MSTGFTRRSLATGIGTAGLGLGGLAILAPNASAQTPFTSFAFQATGEPTARTMPDRLAEIKNVRDFGAVGDGVTDDTTAIQNTVNWTTGANRGTIYFPAGTYNVTAPITFNYNGPLSICFRGDGAASYLTGTFAPGYILDRSLVSPSNQAQVVIEKLQIQNHSGTSGSGAIRVGSCISAVIRDIVVVNGFTCITTEDSPGNSSQNAFIQNVHFIGADQTGCNGLVMGGGGSVQGCDWIGCDFGARMYGNGWYMGGNRIERCNTAYLLGVDGAGTDRGASGFAICGGSTEGNWTGIDFSGTCSGFYIGSMSFLGHSSSNAGMIPNIQGTQYHLLIRPNKASSGIFMGLGGGGDLADVAGGSVGTSTNRANLLFLSCNISKGSSTAPGAVDWILPNNAYTAQWQYCNVAPVWTFSQLPTIGSGNALEGDEFSIRDSNTASWGANAAGSGSNSVLVRNNGSHYTVVAA
jgi:Pectate lyase superfamily protein